MKTHFVIRVYILTDSWGEWWEWLKYDNSTSRFEPGTAEFKRDKEFRTQEHAVKHGLAQGIKVFEVLKLDPPVPPSIEWGMEVVHRHGAVETTSV